MTRPLHLIVLLLALHPTSSIELKVVSTHSGNLGHEPCALLCVGTTGSDSNWYQNSVGHLGIRVNISACAFLEKPVLTVSVDSMSYDASLVVGTATVLYATKDEFTLRMLGYVHTATMPYTHRITIDNAAKSTWNVNWSAVGFVC